MNRTRMNRRLWAAVRELPGGEETLRDLVALINQEDGTNEDVAGTADYSSTRRLSDAQFTRLLREVEQRSKWRKRRRSPDGVSVLWLCSPAERQYIKFLARSLGWSTETLDEFAKRQTKDAGVKTHKQASAVIEPLERMLLKRGWACSEQKGRKWWDPPAPAPAGEAEVPF